MLLTMFSSTTTTLPVASCARLMQPAMRAKDSSFVATPTVDPGLGTMSDRN